MAEASELQLYPAWREGLRRFLAEGFERGTKIEHSWFYDAFSIDMPSPTTPLKEAEKLKLQFLSAFEEMRSALLTEHQVALASIHGFGYRVVPPEEQTTWAEREGVEQVKRSLQKMGDRMINVDLAALSGDLRKQNADALARFAMLSGMVRDVDKGRVGALE